MRSLILMLALVSTPVAAAEQFDLLCKAPGVTEHYRIDLARGEWCFEKCELVQKIAQATSGEIILAEHKPEYRDDRTSHNRINRISGEWEWFNSDPRYTAIQDVKGTCERKEFSGMPAAKF